MRRRRRLGLGWAGFVLVLGACGSLPSAVEPPPDWELDALACAQLRLRPDVPVRASVLEAPAAFPSRAWYVLEYVELPKALGFTVSRPAELWNVYQVSVLSKEQGKAPVPERYQVIDRWSVYPRQNLKICRQWTLSEGATGELAEGTLQLLGLDDGNVLLKEVRRPLSAAELAALAGVYGRIREHFRAAVGAQRAQDLRPAD
jgi:hypothetical protein